MTADWEPGAVGPPARRRRIEADPESVERGLVSLVLTIVELLRQLMERQALRRVEQGIAHRRAGGERRPDADGRWRTGWPSCGTTSVSTPEDLNIDLGPLGPLLPYES